MTAQPSNPNLSILKFAQQELRNFTQVIKDILDRLSSSGPLETEALKSCLKAATEIFNLFKVTRLNQVRPLAMQLEVYFNEIPTEQLLLSEDRALLFSILSEFDQLVKIEAGSILETIQTKQPVYDELISQLKMLTDKKDETTLEITDESIVRLFLNEMGIQIEAFYKELVSLEKDSYSKPALENLIHISHAIEHAGQIINLTSFEEAGYFLKNSFQTLLQEKTSFSKKQFELLFDWVRQVREFSKLDRTQFLASAKKKGQELLTLAKQILALSDRIEKKEKDQKKEIVASTTFEEEEREKDLDPLMFNLFIVEIETQTRALNEGLIEFEKQTENNVLLESLMRAAHSIKGAARVVNLPLIVQLAHAMEDCFVAVQKKQTKLDSGKIDVLLNGVDLLASLANIPLEKFSAWMNEKKSLIHTLIQAISAYKQQETNGKKIESASSSQEIKDPSSFKSVSLSEEPITRLKNTLIENERSDNQTSLSNTAAHDRILRVTAQNMNRLMGLAGESLIESRWLYPFGSSLQKLKKTYNQLNRSFDNLREGLREESLTQKNQQFILDVQYKMNDCRVELSERLAELDHFIRRHASLSDRLYQEVINSRMRPFADGLEGFSRMVRDLARQLGKKVRLEIEGWSTPVDRDILEKLEAPLNHLIRNAIDHGIETPAKRQELNKNPEGVIKLEARHKGGALVITVSDDGRGIDIAKLREKIIDKKLANPEMVEQLTETELIDFLFLSGFSTSSEVTEISGRGIGLNIVQNFVQEVGGVVRVFFQPNKGISFHLQLPLTLSVIRALIVEISGESYAFPLARIDQAFLIKKEEIGVLENRQFFHYEGQNIGLISAWQVLDLKEPPLKLTFLPVIVLSDHLNCYGLVVDRLVGEKELVVQELDPRLGKISDISAGALMEDGTPVLIIDIEDIVRSIDNLLSGGRLKKLSYTEEAEGRKLRKRVLVIDDSITVREVECRLLQNQGYEVETAVNGMDGWNAVRIGHYDLVITDIDMPRLNGIELVRLIKNDSRFRDLPIMIVSYKESKEDRIRGLEAGADYYLTKSSFHDTTLLDAVFDLIGKP